MLGFCFSAESTLPPSHCLLPIKPEMELSRLSHLAENTLQAPGVILETMWELELFLSVSHKISHLYQVD